MIGKYEIDLYNNKIQYHLTIKRNITVLRGDSASGKSELIRLLSLYNSNPESSGITLKCDKGCNVLTEENWKLFIDTYEERIFFIDEGNSFLRSKEFADKVKKANHYFVIISREKMSQLPYSIEEIYGLRESRDSDKYRIAKRVYNEMYQLYGASGKIIDNPELVITEDSNSGYDFFKEVYGSICVSAKGKSNIKRMLAQSIQDNVLAIVDGAAFGPEMQGCMEYINTSKKEAKIYAPESFEYLILKSGVVQVPNEILEETWDYSDSKEFFSWEEYYTYELCERTRNSVSQYSKKHLNDYYLTKGSVEKIKNILPDEIKGYLGLE